VLRNGQHTLHSYLEYMRRQSDESFALLNDLLISVTSVLRDHRAPEALA